MRRWRGLLLSGTALSIGAALSLAGSPVALAACTAAGANPVIITCDDTTTDNTYNPPNNVDARNQIQNDNIDAEVQAGATVDGYGLRIETTLAGGTIDMEHDGDEVILTGAGADTGSALFGPGALELNGNGGLVSYTGSGDVSNLTATGAGLLITNTGDGSVVADVSGTITGPAGIVLSVEGNGTIDLTTNGPVEGTDGHGIHTLAADGDTTITVEADVTATEDGIHARSTTGNITISGAGNITGDSDHDSIGSGIDAASISGGNIDVTVTGDISGASGIVLSTTLAGTIDLTTGGSVVGTSGDGINTVAADGDTTINTTGPVTGADAGIDASATGAGGISIFADSSVDGLTGDGIVTSTSTGDTVIVANGSVVGGADGINTSASDGNTTIRTRGLVSGGDDGIDATATGAGSISIRANDSVDGVTGDGIVTSAFDGDTRIVTNGAVTGFDNGITASATGDGAISIRANDSVDGLFVDGIVTSAFDGDTRIVTNGSVVGNDDGIDATATGDGAISIVTNDSVDGLTGDGIVTSAVDGDTAIVTNAAVDGGGDDGIDASATGAGAISILAEGAVTGADHGIEARSTTGDITIAGDGNITGDSDSNLIGDGINAASIGGGNIDVNVTGDVSGASGIVLSTTLAGTIDLTTGGAVAGTVGDGINTVAVDGVTTIVTNDEVTGEDDGIDATATGAGAISIRANDTVDGLTGDGIVTSASNGNTAIEANAAVTGADDGIEVRSTTGDITISGAGNITGDSDSDLIGDGINAASTGGGNIDVNVTGDVSGASGIVLSTALAGTVDLTTGGAVDGIVGDGINTVAVNGDTTIVTNGPVTGADDGIDASATGDGAISIHATNSVDGFFGDGIVTSAFDGDTRIETNGPVVGEDDGIDATATGAGAISIFANDTVDGLAGDGIVTSAFDGVTQIVANAAVEGGEDGIDATATGGGNINVGVDSGVEVTGLGGSGVSTNTAAGEATISNNHGLIQGAFAAISGATSTMLHVVNQAGGLIQNLSEDIGDLAISVTGTGNTDIANNGTIRGRVELGSGDDAFTNSGLWRSTGGSDFGAGNDSVTNFGVWRETIGGTDFGAGNDTVVNHRLWQTTGDTFFGAGYDTVTNYGRLDVTRLAEAESTHFIGLESFTNASTGSIGMYDNNVGDELTIDGVYTGEAGSFITMDLDLVSINAPIRSDLLILDGANAAQGTSDLLFVIVSTDATASTADATDANRAVFDGGQLVAPEGVTVVQNRGNLATSSGTDDIPIARSGLINYDLVSAGGDFRVVSELDTGLAGGLLLPIPATLANVALTSQRTPNPITATCIDPDNKANAQGGWARGLAGEFNTESSGKASTGGVTTGLESENRTRFETLQGGFDYVWCNLGNFASTLHLGVTVGQTWGESIQEDPDAAARIFGTDVAFDTFFVGPYAAMTRGNFAAQAALRFDHHSLELSNPTDGIEANDLDVDAEGISGSASMSYDFELATLTLTPDVGVNVSNTETDSFEIAGGTVVLDDLWSVIGHAGVTARTQPLGVADNLFVVPFASATLYHEFIEHADGQIDVGGTVIETQSNRVGTFGQVGIGANAVRLGNVVTGRPTLFGGARFDLQVGERIEGATATVFGRVQF